MGVIGWGLGCDGVLALPSCCSLFASGTAFAAWEWNFQPPATPIAAEIINLHSLIFWICVVIFVGVFGVMFYSMFKHRKSVGHQAAQFHENTTVEIVWTVVPFLILIFMALPATKTIVAMKDTSAPDLTIKVTGYQWKWGYDYLQAKARASASSRRSRRRARRSRAGEPKGEQLPARGRQPAGRAGRQEGPHHHHRRTT